MFLPVTQHHNPQNRILSHTAATTSKLGGVNKLHKKIKLKEYSSCYTGGTYHISLPIYD
jgi:hypothetical protein